MPLSISQSFTLSPAPRLQGLFIDRCPRVSSQVGSEIAKTISTLFLLYLYDTGKQKVDRNALYKLAFEGKRTQAELDEFAAASCCKSLSQEPASERLDSCGSLQQRRKRPLVELAGFPATTLPLFILFDRANLTGNYQRILQSRYPYLRFITSWNARSLAFVESLARERPDLLLQKIVSREMKYCDTNYEIHPYVE